MLIFKTYNVGEKNEHCKFGLTNATNGKEAVLVLTRSVGTAVMIGDHIVLKVISGQRR